MPRLAFKSWPQVDAYLERSKLILVPIGSTEQHGPNGLIGTDFISATVVAERAAEELGALVAPTIPVGMALHHMAFAGTISFQPATLIAVMGDYVRSLYRHGFRVIVFVNGHGGNIATANAALSGLREEMPDAQLAWLDWYQAPAVSQRARALYGDREGHHATPSEVSVTMAAEPGAVEPIEGPLDIESCRSRGIADSQTFRAWYPDGRMGSDPSMARAEHGEELIALSAAAVVDEVRKRVAAYGVVSAVDDLLS